MTRKKTFEYLIAYCIFYLHFYEWACSTGANRSHNKTNSSLLIHSMYILHVTLSKVLLISAVIDLVM